MLGRFASADTIIPGAGNPQSWDRFAYVNNNPLRYTDPSGHMMSEGDEGGGDASSYEQSDITYLRTYPRIMLSKI